MNIRRRLEALEKGILRDPITLTMPDGRAETFACSWRRLAKKPSALNSGELGFDSSIDGRQSHGRHDPLFPARSGRRP
jgi:hypothetical protein